MYMQKYFFCYFLTTNTVHYFKLLETWIKNTQLGYYKLFIHITNIIDLKNESAMAHVEVISAHKL